jgi:3',5'-cyclic-AMP phosphodiesterase
MPRSHAGPATTDELSVTRSGAPPYRDAVPRRASRRPAIEIDRLHDRPIAEVRYLNASRRGRPESARLTVQRATTRGLPGSLDAIVVTSDLQGIVRDWSSGGSTLLGVRVAKVLVDLADEGRLPSLSRTGVLLAGDLYSEPGADKRGGHGDVAAVWQAFAASFTWVVGVAGNHDDVTGVVADGLLDMATTMQDGLRIGGVGLICGNPARLGRRSDEDQLGMIDAVAREEVDILVLHEGPDGGPDQPGRPEIRRLVEQHQVPLTVCGHVHWDEPLARHSRGLILNVDSRVIVLTR